MAIRSQLSRFPFLTVGTNWHFCVDVPLNNQLIYYWHLFLTEVSRGQIVIDFMDCSPKVFRLLFIIVYATDTTWQIVILACSSLTRVLKREYIYIYIYILYMFELDKDVVILMVCRKTQLIIITRFAYTKYTNKRSYIIIDCGIITVEIRIMNSSKASLKRVSIICRINTHHICMSNNYTSANNLIRYNHWLFNLSFNMISIYRSALFR